MLHDATDIPRLIACAADQARHDRMLDITGGDTAALTEITDVQDLLLRLDEPDLPALARLNVHRSIIAERNAHVPADLPVVWATVGHPERAEALARAITDPDQRAQALAGLAEVAARAGDLDWPGGRGGGPGDHRPDRRARALAAWRRRRRARVTWTGPGALAGQAEAAARAITDPDRRARALAAWRRRRRAPVTWTGPTPGRQAEAGLGRSPTRDERARALAVWRQAARGAGDLDRARRWPSRPRRRPRRSPTRTGGRGRWPAWRSGGRAGDRIGPWLPSRPRRRPRRSPTRTGGRGR